MNVQPDLFGRMPSPPPTPLAQRRKARDKALERAGAAFKKAYEGFILSYLATHERASAEEIRLSYEKTSLPKPPSKRASGSIFTQLRRTGRIREVGRERSQLYGNFLVTYSLVK